MYSELFHTSNNATDAWTNLSFGKTSKKCAEKNQITEIKFHSKSWILIKSKYEIESEKQKLCCYHMVTVCFWG